MKRFLCLFALGMLTISAEVRRPPIVGIARVSFYVGDREKADQFYGHVLGYAPTRAGYQVNESQFIQILPGLSGDAQDRLAEVAFETRDARKLRAYLASKGVSVPERVERDAEGNLSFKVDDPEGRHLAFVQYKHAAKMAASNEISKRIIHAGFIVHDRALEDRFYHDILGFTVMWYGGKTDSDVNWVDMRVPDGDDWLEYMLGVKNPSVRSRGVNNHFALGATEIQAAYQQVLQRGYKPPEPPKIGRDGKWQLNLYDPDQTRVEMMEFKPVEKPCCSPMLTK